ncbi:hypothetical protein, partial [Marinomonas arenicola]
MKLRIVVVLGLMLSACSLLEPPVAHESYFVPIIQSDANNSGYKPSVTPVVKNKTKEVPRVYPSPV